MLRILYTAHRTNASILVELKIETQGRYGKQCVQGKVEGNHRQNKGFS